MGKDKSEREKPEKGEESGKSGMGESDVSESPSPSFDEVVRKMLNTPPKPKKNADAAARKRAAGKRRPGRNPSNDD